MKKPLFLIVIAILSVSFYKPVKAEDLTGKTKVSLALGANIPTNGNQSATLKSTDLFNVGFTGGINLSHYFTQGFGLEIVHNSGFNFYKDKYSLNNKKPVMCINSFSLDAVYNFGHLFDNSNFQPYLRAGAGAYLWGHLEDGLTSDPMKMGNNEHEAWSAGCNVGIGADYSVSKEFSIGLIVDYHSFFPKDETKFGKDYDVQGYLLPQLKFTYTFSGTCCK